MTTRKAATKPRTRAGQATRKTGGTRKRVTARAAALDAHPATVRTATARTVQRTERGTYAPRPQQPEQQRHPTAADIIAVALVLFFILVVGGGSVVKDVLRAAVASPPAQFQAQPAFPSPAGGQP